MAKHVKRLIAALITLLVLWVMIGYVAVSFVLMPRHVNIPDRELLGGKPVENVSIRTEDGVTLSAWCVKADPDRAVILLPGIGADRRQCAARGEYYLQLGYSVLLPDLRGTGKSGGDLVTIGWRECRDLVACFKYLHEAGYRRVGADGISLGAATICYALRDLPDLAFVVLESCYDTIDSAFDNRLDYFRVPRFLARPARWFAQLRIGAGPEQMRPVDFMPFCKAPTLVLSGDNEGYLKVSETKAIFDRCAAEKKRLYIFPGGRHEDFLRAFPDQYKKQLREFLLDVSAPWDQAETVSAARRLSPAHSRQA
jgi:hypothetical protein